MGLFKKSKEKIHSKAMDAYHNKDYKKAVSLFSEAAEMDLAESNDMLAQCYDYGLGVEKDAAKALALYEKAMRLGSNRGAERIAVLQSREYLVKGTAFFHEKKYDEAKKWYLKAESLSPSDVSANNIAVSYEVERDLEAAKKWYIEAYKRGDHTALPCILRVSKDTDDDHFDWMKIAANEGNADAKEYVAKEYLRNSDTMLQIVEDQLGAAVEAFTKSLLDGKEEVYIVALAKHDEAITIHGNTYANVQDFIEENGYFMLMNSIYATIDWELFEELKDIGNTIQNYYNAIKCELNSDLAGEITWNLDKKVFVACKNAMRRFKETDTYRAFPKLFLFANPGELDANCDDIFIELNGENSLVEYLGMLDEVNKSMYE